MTRVHHAKHLQGGAMFRDHQDVAKAGDDQVWEEDAVALSEKRFLDGIEAIQ
jgi:hypothetical protein